jgi:tetratricopeptide (TPR) repeat protein
MQSLITDTEAAVFSRAFYPALMDGEPLETCVARGRKLIYAQGDRSRPGWAAPVLYSNLPDGILFDHIRHAVHDQRPDGGPVSRPGGDLRPVVTQLPAPWYGELRHRGGELRRIIDAMAGDEPDRLIVISGPPGSGKSSLALEAGLRCLGHSRKEPGSPRAFAGVIWLSRRSPTLSGPIPVQRAMGWGVEELNRQLVEALPVPGLRQARPYERSDLMRAALRRSRYLLIIDDFDELHGLTLEELADRLPPPTTVIVTSHAPLRATALGVTLRKLSAGQAADLVRRAAAANGAQGEVTPNLRALGDASGNPLALRLLAGRLADGEDVAAAAAARTGAAPQGQGLLRLIVRESLGRCSAEEMAALRTVALYPEPLEPAEVASALDKSTVEVAGILARLRRLGLVNMADDETISVPQRIRHETLCELEEAPAETLIRRAVAHSLTMIGRYTVDAESDQPPYTDAQIRNALWACSQAYALRDWTSVLKFRDGLHEVLFRQELWNEGIELGEWAYDAADRLGEDEAQAWCALYPMARHHFYQADYQASRLWSERALDKFGKLGHTYGTACAQRYLGRAMQASGFPDEARRLFQEGLLHSEGSLKGHLIAALADLAERRADFETARRGYQDALEVYRHVGHSSGIATAEHRLGCIAVAQGHHDEAREHLTQSLRLFVRHDWPDRRAKVLQSLADLEESLGKFGEAGAYLLEAEKAAEPLGAHADLIDVDARLTRIARKLAERRESKKDGISTRRAASSGTLLDQSTMLSGSLGLGSADGIRLVGDLTLSIADIPIVSLRCPVEDCHRTRTAYDYWSDYWPDCPDHHVRMVDTEPAAGLS